MTSDLHTELQSSLEEREKIEEALAIRDKKDRKLISAYCAENDPADIYRILDLLIKFNGLPDYDRETVESFKNGYPGKLSVKLILAFEDIMDIYSKFLESGGNDDE